MQLVFAMLNEFADSLLFVYIANIFLKRNIISNVKINSILLIAELPVTINYMGTII